MALSFNDFKQGSLEKLVNNAQTGRFHERIEVDAKYKVNTKRVRNAFIKHNSVLAKQPFEAGRNFIWQDAFDNYQDHLEKDTTRFKIYYDTETVGPDPSITVTINEVSVKLNDHTRDFVFHVQFNESSGTPDYEMILK